MKKKFAYFILIPFGCLLLLYLLNWSNTKETKNGFDRKLMNTEIKLVSLFKLDNGYFGLVGNAGTEIWLRNYKDPLALYKMDFSLKKLTKLTLSTPQGFAKKILNINYDHLDSAIYMTNGWQDIAVFKGAASSLFSIPNLIFDEPNAISIQSIAVRIFRNDGKRQTGLALAKLELADPARISHTFALPKQVDGIICADGMFHFDRSLSRLYYIYFHRGEFLSLDTNLALRYRAKTIDTITFANLKLTSINVKVNHGKTVKKLTEAIPPKLVNRYAAFDRGMIYVLSGLKGDNESAKASKEKEAIDVYAASDGKYQYSFYVPKYKGFRLREFVVSGNLLIGIYRDYLVSYNIPT